MFPEQQTKKLKTAYGAATICPECKHDIHKSHRVDETGGIWCSGADWKCKCGEKKA
jgi:hypothetical protein